MFLERRVGLHLIVDGYGGDPVKLQDAALLERFLDRYPAVLGMNKIAEPQVHTYSGEKPEDWGLSGFVLIAESHISIHTFPERESVNIDIFSCRDFDPQHALEQVKQTFGLSSIRRWILERSVGALQEAAREAQRPG